MNINKLNEQYFSAVAWILSQRKIEYNDVKVKRGGRSLNYAIRLSNPLTLNDSLKLAEPIALACQSQGVIIQRQLGYLSCQIALPESLWMQYYLGEHVTGLGIGVTDDKEIIEYNFNSNSSLIAATTGGGKTFCGFASVLALCNYYSPEELKIVFVDSHRYFDEYKSPDGKTQFVTFRNESHVVQFDYGSVAYLDEDIETAIDYVYNEAKHRIQNQIMGASHLLLVIDEVDSLFAENELLINKVRFIAKNARKFNIHLMILSQEPTKANIPIRDLLGNRFVGKQEMRKTEVTSLIGAPVDARNLTIKGHDFFHCESGNVQRFTVVKLRESDFNNLERGHQATIEIAKSNDIVDMPVGRPVKEFDTKLLAYLWLVGPDKYSNSLISKHFGIYHERIQKHKDWVLEFGKLYMKMRRMKLDGHPKYYK